MATTNRPGFSSFWHDLPREGKMLLTVVVFEFIGTGLVLPFHLIYLHEVRGFSLSDVGIMLSILPVAGLLVLGPSGTAIDRVGARPILIGSLVSVCIGETMMAFASTWPIVMIALALTGMSFGVSWPAAQTMIANVVPSDIRQRYFGVNFSLLNLGIGLGGVIGGLYVNVHDTATFQAIYLCDALSYLPSMALLLGPLRHIAGRPERPEDETATTLSYLEVLRRPAMRSVTILGLVTSMVGYSQLNTGVPAFARAVSHVSTRGVGFAFAANCLVIVLIQLVVLRFIEGRRRTRVLAAMGVIWALSYLLLGASGLVPGTLGATLLVAGCASVFALGETLLQPTFPAIVNDLAPDHLRGRYNALSSASFQVGAVIAPIVAGAMIGRHLDIEYIASISIGALLLSAYALGRLERELTPEVNGVRLTAAELATPPAAAAMPVAGVDN
jgi:MFS family permease